MLSPLRFFDPEPTQRAIALDLYTQIKDLPIVSPHGHVDPAIFRDPNHRFGNPVELLIQPDHYVLRMLYSQGVAYEVLLDSDHPRQVWQTFAENMHLFRGTPSGMWLAHELETVFGIDESLTPQNAAQIYEQIEAALHTPVFSARSLFMRFKIEVLATTDAATSTLEHHQAIRRSGWSGNVIPTFRPDDVTNLLSPKWKENLARLSQISGITIIDYRTFVQALEHRRDSFRSLGATATDISPTTTDTTLLTAAEVERIFQRALHEQASPADGVRFAAHSLQEMARMSADDGMVMQIHPGVHRNHNPLVYERFGADRGFDIPVATEFTRSLLPLLQRFGNHPNLRMILFTLDESTYARELAPLVGAYPSIKLGPPWWFHDSWNGMRRYFDQVMETAGIYNTAGFNDDTRAFLSIPARHDVWRRAAANWLASLEARNLIHHHDAETMAIEMASGLVKRAYRLNEA
jgi:glucuronate isomerase